MQGRQGLEDCAYPEAERERFMPDMSSWRGYADTDKTASRLSAMPNLNSAFTS